MPAVRVFHSLSLALLAICLLAAPVSAVDPLITPVAEPLAAENDLEFKLYCRMLSRPVYSLDDRRTAAVLLLEGDWPEGINEVLTVLENNKDSQGQLAVAEALAETLPKLDSLPDRFVDPLIAALSAEDENLRQAAALALANYNDKILPQLGQILLQRDLATGEVARLAVVAAIERIKDKKSVQILIEALDDNNPQLSARCRQGLEHLTGIRPGDSNAAWQHWWQQYKEKPLAEWLRIWILALQNQNRQLRSRVDRISEQLQSQIEDRWKSAQDKPKLLQEFLDNELQDVRLQGLNLARDLLPIRPFPSQAQEKIRQMLVADTSASVRILAAELLRDLRDKQAATILLERLPHETDPKVRASFADALGHIGGAEAVEPLIKLLDEADPLVVGRAALALGNLASDGDVAPLKTSIVEVLLKRYEKIIPTNGADAELRSQILSAMAQVGSPSFRPLFLEALKDSSARSRIAALEGLRSLPPGGHSKETLDAILSLLADSDRSVRLEVLTALDYLANLGALDALEKRLDPNVELDVDVRNEVWRVITNLLAKAGLDILNDWERKAVVVDDPGRHEQVLGILENRLAEVQPNPIQLIEVRERRGDLFAALKSWEAAAMKYRLAYDQAKTFSDPSISQTRDGLALKLLKALLNQPAFDQVAEHLGAIPSPLEEDALNLTLDYLQSLLDPPVASKNIAAALELISILERAHLPGLSQPPFSNRLRQLKAEAEALNLRRNSNNEPGAP